MLENGDEDSKKGTQQLEIIQIDIQMSTIRKDNKRLKQLYEKSKSIKSAIPHPLTKGLIYLAARIHGSKLFGPMVGPGILTLPTEIKRNFVGIIYECGGKMHLSEESFQLAHTDFFEAFKCFDEAGSPRRISSLKYLGKALD